ncbi:MAG: ATP-binding protein [Ottowia sp.]|nr:ATP-binding protein [Ottowia sp.]
MVFERELAAELRRCAGMLPVVTLLGPRQSGKTTLARAVFPNHAYANLEDPDTLRLSREDPRGFFAAFPPPVVIDEVQRNPGLLSRIQTMADADQTPGRFILTGSHQPLLQGKIAQTLAGRTALCTLLPLSLRELAASGIRPDRDTAIFRGGLPRVHASRLPPRRVYGDYLRTYVERDARALVNVSDWTRFETFLRLLAGRVGQALNLQSLAGDVGASSTTLAKWLAVLEASFVIFRLPPYWRNFGKRFIKAPKVYFTDTGLAANLLGIDAPEQVGRDPLLGGLFENLVVLEALKARLNAGLEPSLYFIRDNGGIEIDLVFDVARRLHLREIKASMTPDLSFGRHMARLRKAVLDVASSGVYYAGDPWPLPPDGRFIPFTETAADIDGCVAHASQALS